ncbi:unnamed protein product [Hymenolepis diminuta]|uniref:Basic proline-rich protein-like n=1 Tax=Hymenolepis diminuta TaxID=6216 RepID=A0A0R3SSH1_HYMDI|nr:unnamed protein product [Hymenolepis diminuta]VUZ52177.1 unnamed protein product [Hymenolepis diminuta]
MFLRTVLLCLLICSLTGAYLHLPQNYIYDFSGCTTSTCRDGQSVGYGCIDGNCTYACSDGFCSGYQAYQHVLPPISHQYLVSPWGYGAIKHQEGCNGGNCGYWGGCVNGYCGGYYDFRACPYRDCESGPFRGYGCRSGNCQIICLGGNCYIVRTYGTHMRKRHNRVPQPPPHEPYEIQQAQPSLVDIGETFEKKDMWMLKNLNSTGVFNMVKSWVKDEKAFKEMKPNGDEVKFILNEFRKRNRMQVRLQLWREEKKNELYMNMLCPYRRNQLYQCPYQCPYECPNECPYECPNQCPNCPNQNPGCPGGCQPQPPMIPYQSCPHQQCPYHQWPPKVPQQSPPPNYYKPEQPFRPPLRPPPPVIPSQPWSPPQVPYNCPGGCPPPKLPLSPAPINPPQPWSPPQVPYKCPGGCPPPKLPLSPAPINPPQPWSPPQLPYRCPGSCPKPKPLPQQ